MISTRAALLAMLRRRRGRLLVVSSTAAGTADNSFIERNTLFEQCGAARNAAPAARPLTRFQHPKP